MSEYDIISDKILIVVCVVAILLLIKIVIKWVDSTQECLVSKPNNMERMHMARQVLTNQELFHNNKSTLPNIREKIDWMDAITYEDIRRLSRADKLNYQNIIEIL